MRQINPALQEVMDPPIGVAYAWIEDKIFPKEFPLIDLSQAVPGYPPAPALNAHMAELILSDPSIARYAPAQGLQELREALSANIGHVYGKEPGAERLIITAGCNQAFCLVACAIAEPGDECILPLPYYFDHDMWLRAQGIKPVYLPFHADRPGQWNLGEIENKIHARTRAIVLVTPNNPTGVTYPPDVLQALFDLARAKDIYLILDETYRDFIPPRPHDLFLTDGWDRHFIHLYSFSKVFAMTGYRAGAIATSPALIRQLLKLMDAVAVCAPRLAQKAALYGILQLDDWKKEKAAMMQERLKVLRQNFSRNDLPFDLVSAGAYFAYIRHRFSNRSSLEVAKALLEKSHVLALPGTMFGPGQEEYLRLAFANVEADRIPEIVTRLARFSI